MRQRKTLAQVCAQREWTFATSANGYLIRTGYEEFRVEYCGEDVFIVDRRVVGGVRDIHITKINQHIYPATARNLAANLDRLVTIFNDEQYLLYWAEIIAGYCKQMNIRCEYKFGMIYLYTDVEEFYIEPYRNNLQKFDLFHRGIKTTTGRKGNAYHRQATTSLHYDNVVRYVHNHTATKYGNIEKGSSKYC